MIPECPLCSRKYFIPDRLKIGPRTYNACSACELIQLNRKYLVSEEEEKNRYMLHNNSITDKKYTDYLQNIILNYIKPYVHSKSRILDFGSGPEPVLSRLLKNSGYKNVYIYDRFFADNIEALNNTYNCIITVEVLEHIIDIKDVLRKLTNILLPGGFFIIHTLLHNNSDFENWWYAHDKTHVSFFSDKTVREICRIFHLKDILITGSAAVIKKA